MCTWSACPVNLGRLGSRPGTDHSRIFPPLSPEASVPPSGRLKATVYTALDGPMRRVFRDFPLRPSQSRIVPLSPAEASERPSGLKTML